MFRLGLLRNDNDENMMRERQAAEENYKKKSENFFANLMRCDKNSRPEEKKMT